MAHRHNHVLTWCLQIPSVQPSWELPMLLWQRVLGNSIYGKEYLGTPYMYICTCTRQAALDRWQQEVASVQYEAGILNIYIYSLCGRALLCTHEHTYMGEPCCVYRACYTFQSFIRLNKLTKLSIKVCIYIQCKLYIIIIYISFLPHTLHTSSAHITHHQRIAVIRLTSYQHAHAAPPVLMCAYICNTPVGRAASEYKVRRAAPSMETLAILFP